MKTAIRRAATALVLISVATVSAASTLDAPAQRTVKFGDLNLETDSGVALLYARIRDAARDVCETESVWNIQGLLASRDCTERAIERAVEDIDAPLLKSYYHSQSHLTAMEYR